MSEPPIRGDGARSANPDLDRLLVEAQRLHPKKIDLTLDRLRRVLTELGNPEASLPPVFHVAGTNGKGSVSAFLRASLEAGGKSVHVYTSPHLVRFNERVRLGGTLVEDAALMSALSRVMEANGGRPLTFFELTTAAAFLEFARVPADALILEVGLGGRFDATNMVAPAGTAACGLTHISLDHQQFLGDNLVDIAAEKAGIAKAGVPLIAAHHSAPLMHRIAQAADEAGATYLPRGNLWDATFSRNGIDYRDRHGELRLSAPALKGRHQHENAGLAAAMLRHQDKIAVPDSALRAGPRWASWPARLQQLTEGTLIAPLPDGVTVTLDGGHNPGAGAAIGQYLKRRRTRGQRQPVTLIVGMVEGKDVPGFLQQVAPHADRLIAVPITGHVHESPDRIRDVASSLGLTAETAADVTAALSHAGAEGPPRDIMVCGSLYLAGEMLDANGTPPN
ncbi:bifunctional folylpolyglutamate synthase/dihydrofolate synthase [Pacificimonas flava]|uniref:Dihydrofolate synthase/folylpolyglutamate synthase n=2 Tax=Pacificimonas TaxID=1960290 RepID=A0A219B2R0_9SPHN|nr:MULTISPECIES: folylpolyglutamate synthase/dihydrofolate synthase family protein [Pacificimonas]MBZ6378275.1 bifunctional folylpolyglutamate synthase/dihydrofolate synthase [Pacificimonas aurantium]OWV32109.1 bifunctional folylpolyglutamate synthase/dihydrofolate synthase [Pacificimonas flava]